jgi:hypothetical protein
VAYLGNDLQVAFPTYRNIDDISGSFNGVTTSFPLTVDGVAPIPAPVNSQQCLISVNGVVQRPDDSGAEGFLLSGGNIVFASAPAGGVDFFGVILAGADYINIGANFPSGTALVPSITFDSDLDTGIYNPAGNQIGFTTAGVQRLVINSSGQVSGGLGSATTPAFSFLSDPNTGIYSPGADQVAVATNGTGRLFVDASGRVGIGNSSPGSLLTARSTSSPTISIENNSSAGSGVVLFRSGGTNYGLQDRINIKGLITDSATGATALTVETSAGDLASPAERLRITSAGLVGIGTSSPAQALSVVGGISATTPNGTICQLTLEQTSQNAFSLQIPASTQRFAIKDLLANAERFVINSAGNVGIGTTSPSGKLTVVSAVAGGTDYTNEQVSIFNSQTGVAGNQATLGFHLNNVNWGSATTFARVSAILENGTTGATALAFGTATDGSLATPNERARIDSSGRLLVGTSTSVVVAGAAAVQQIVGTPTSDRPIGLHWGGASPTAPYIQFSKSRNATYGSYTIVSNGDVLGGLLFAGDDGTDYSSVGSLCRRHPWR